MKTSVNFVYILNNQSHCPYTEKICRLKSHRLCVILVDRLESPLNIINLLIKECDR